MLKFSGSSHSIGGPITNSYPNVWCYYTPHVGKLRGCSLVKRNVVDRFKLAHL
jgi:hypothetical protein